MLRLRRLPALASVLAVACATLAVSTPALGATSTVLSKTFSAAETTAAKSFWTPSRVSATKNASLIPLTGATTLAAPSGSGPASPTAVPGPTVGSVPVVLGALFQPGYPYDPYYAPIKSTGRLDFTYPDGTPSYCSASAVRSETRNDVLTAAHCLYSVPGSSNSKHGAGWHSNLRFTPGYKNGAAPWGRWYVSRTVVNSWWAISGANDLDVGLLSMHGRNGQSLYSVTGGPAIVTNLPYDQDIMLLGYSWNYWGGGRLAYCSGAMHPRSVELPAKVRLFLEAWSCSLTSGMSGGPVWLYGGYGSNPWTGAGGLVNGVQSAYIPGTSPTTVTSAYFGNDVQALFNSVRNI
jgi:V8-like Glu-specific endopeptidase